MPVGLIPVHIRNTPFLKVTYRKLVLINVASILKKLIYIKELICAHQKNELLLEFISFPFFPFYMWISVMSNETDRLPCQTS